ncbi:hypothetical protein EK21DRAFT_115571 [Setomelanomma holmii]|uniref:Uncharacterized protein n=1 Tax=Setomelanomma holmii TaxID=210430 RepID=A0A9P4H3H5_9PLEO|nr:hypothetical protein EK21DRAFT_115571 [Setomelanomma holmii]
MDTKFLHGIPVLCIDEALLWMARDPSGPRRRKIMMVGKHTEPFPTWTWAGWQNYCDYMTEFGHCSIWPEVEWFIITIAGDIIPLIPPKAWRTTRPFDSFCPSNHKDVRPTGTLSVPSLRTPATLAQISPRDLEMCSLGCWSSIAPFQLHGNTVEPDEDYELSQYVNLIISDSKFISVGSIRMDPTWLEAVEGQTKFEFMLMLRASQFDSVPKLDETAFPVDEWCFINVMLVELRNNVVARLGIGVIYENAWVAANPISTFMKLR